MNKSIVYAIMVVIGLTKINFVMAQDKKSATLFLGIPLDSQFRSTIESFITPGTCFFYLGNVSTQKFDTAGIEGQIRNLLDSSSTYSNMVAVPESRNECSIPNTRIDFVLAADRAEIYIAKYTGSKIDSIKIAPPGAESLMNKKKDLQLRLEYLIDRIVRREIDNPSVLGCVSECRKYQISYIEDNPDLKIVLDNLKLISDDAPILLGMFDRKSLIKAMLQVITTNNKYKLLKDNVGVPSPTLTQDKAQSSDEVWSVTFGDQTTPLSRKITEVRNYYIPPVCLKNYQGYDAPKSQVREIAPGVIIIYGDQKFGKIKIKWKSDKQTDVWCEEEASKSGYLVTSRLPLGKLNLVQLDDINAPTVEMDQLSRWIDVYRKDIIVGSGQVVQSSFVLQKNSGNFIFKIFYDGTGRFRVDQTDSRSLRFNFNPVPIESEIQQSNTLTIYPAEGEDLKQLISISKVSVTVPFRIRRQVEQVGDKAQRSK